MCASLKLKLEWNEIVTCVIWKYFITSLALRQDEIAMERFRADTYTGNCVTRVASRFCHEHIWQRYNRTMHGALRDSLIEIWINRVSKSDGIIASETNGPCWIARRPIAGARVAERRFVSKDRKSLSANWIAPLFEDALSSKILSFRFSKIKPRSNESNIFPLVHSIASTKFNLFFSFGEYIHRYIHRYSRRKKRGQKMRVTMTVAFYFITFYFINSPPIIAAAKAVKKWPDLPSPIRSVNSS